MAVLASVAAAWLLQMPALPTPTGAFAIGAVTGPLLPLPSQASRTAFTAQIWYPARPKTTGTALFESAQIAWHGLRFNRRFMTAATSAAPPADHLGGFPLLVYVPEWGGVRTSNTGLAQELASQGFIVAAMDPVIASAPSQAMDLSSAEASSATLRLAERLVRAQAQDAAELLDRLRAALSHDGTFATLAGRIDFDRVGIFGFSFGGAVAAQACWTDNRFRAALDMDGWLFGDAAQAGFAQPLMVMSDDTPLPSGADLTSSRPETRFTSELNLADNRRTVAIMERSGGTRATIFGARHANFSDLPLIWPIRRMVGAGPVPPMQAYRLISDYAGAFFGKHLKGEDPFLLRPGTVPPEGVRLEQWTVPKSR